MNKGDGIIVLEEFTPIRSGHIGVILTELTELTGRQVLKVDFGAIMERLREVNIFRFKTPIEKIIEILNNIMTKNH